MSDGTKIFLEDKKEMLAERYELDINAMQYVGRGHLKEEMWAIGDKRYCISDDTLYMSKGIFEGINI